MVTIGITPPMQELIVTTPPDGPQKSLTLQEIDAWVLTAQERHAALTIQAARAGDGSHLQEAFAAMSALAQDALTTIHVLRKQLREASQAAQARSIALHDHHTQVLEQSLVAMERLAQF